MKETLLQRCQREAREKYYEKKSPDCGNLDAVIANTLKQVSEEVHAELTVKAIIDGTYDNGFVKWETVEKVLKTALTDVQRLLEFNETV